MTHPAANSLTYWYCACSVNPTAHLYCPNCERLWQEVSRKQNEDTAHVQQQLTSLRQQLSAAAAQQRKATAEAASQQASSNYLIKHLQNQLLTYQASDSSIQSEQQDDTGWTVQQATASVAKLLKSMSSS